MSYSVLPIAGVDLGENAYTNLNSAGTAIPTIGPLGLQTFGADGIFLYLLGLEITCMSLSVETRRVNYALI